ncbi:hypothetical protein, partial [Enterobacter sichuanensis]
MATFFVFYSQGILFFNMYYKKNYKNKKEVRCVLGRLSERPPGKFLTCSKKESGVAATPYPAYT